MAYSNVSIGCLKTLPTDFKKPRIFMASLTSPNSCSTVGAKRSMTIKTSMIRVGIGSFLKLAVSFPDGIFARR